MTRKRGNQSGGLKSEDGRVASSRNSLKYGITSSDVTRHVVNRLGLPEWLQVLHDELIKHISKDDEISELLLQRALIAAWRHKRAFDALSWMMATDLHSITDLNKSKLGWKTEARHTGFEEVRQSQAQDLRQIRRVAGYEHRYGKERDKAIREILDRQPFV